jgi:very-short-patch-repair endonuclease
MSRLKARYDARARSLRSNSTDAEHRLWYHLRDRRLLGFKFVRQAPIGPFVADFACREADLVVELDGGQHAGSQRDGQRTMVLAEHGYAVLRFWNDDVLGNTEGVLQAIAGHLAKAASPGLRVAKSDLSPRGEVSRGTAAPPITSPSRERSPRSGG